MECLATLLSPSARIAEEATACAPLRRSPPLRYIRMHTHSLRLLLEIPANSFHDNQLLLMSNNSALFTRFWVRRSYSPAVGMVRGGVGWSVLKSQFKNRRGGGVHLLYIFKLSPFLKKPSIFIPARSDILGKQPAFHCTRRGASGWWFNRVREQCLGTLPRFQEARLCPPRTVHVILPGAEASIFLAQHPIQG